MVIYANQTLRIAYTAMSKLLQELSKAQSLDQINLSMSSMEEIFELQKMYEIKNQEKNIEKNLKKLGYLS